jgi:uncharacterized protein with PIN domain
MRFIADVMLGRLARFLRFHGYDVEYDNHATDQELLQRSRRRILLTRDRPLAARRKNIYLVKTSGAENQLEEIQSVFPLPAGNSLRPIRCMVCNSRIRRIAKKKVAHLVPPFIFRRHDNFFLCPDCRRIYWEGTHYEAMMRMIK